jgi:hypothetical protein
MKKIAPIPAAHLAKFYLQKKRYTITKALFGFFLFLFFIFYIQTLMYVLCFVQPASFKTMHYV